ncbi:restriction system-associated AAA family ATPase [Aestuariibaculum sediminum]|uniref:Restriction system-associated AAA family ATPase n=1 Tax=Aestuariibaculum sediminum TaxID=2770637 RepID=A0A8J6Q283_9FLAO|nr:restriction system-associated AAA family ATPase [Aestuariibaculum sediminum]MBD0831829.1 restriction system-associated AAA family ATPase [Aestuariibaculum sediminum]
MKLLKLKIENKEGFRSLQQGFEINFHSLSDTEAMEHFRPFCFAGLNGSGKSNVLEALANIFYHLEVCVAKYLPESIKNPKNFKRNECTPDAFTLEYLIGQHNRKNYTLYYFDKVIISKKEGKEPQMFIQPFPFDSSTEIREISLHPPKIRDSAADGKDYLPAHVIGYSSGENEILSLPFIKSRLIHLDEFRQATGDNYDRFDEPENSLIYIDNNMSQAVLLVCLLFENKNTLVPLRHIDNTGILGLRSFRMNIHLHDFEFQDQKTKKTVKVPILKLLEQHQLDDLKKCATSWFLDQKTKTLWLDFYVNEATKLAFKEHFHSSLECFQLFRLLYELNNHFVDEVTKDDVYRSKGVYTDGKLPVGSPRQDVFHFLDFYITKELKTGKVKDLLLRSFSDGEHQFIHTMGICLLLKDKRSLLLLDEPETHFNPSWRAKFVKVLNDSISSGNPKGLSNGDFNVHLLKDILLTSHSPFIISDCLPDNVVLFEKNEDGDTTSKKVSELDNAFNTYGTSVELILDRLFNYDQSIGDLSNSELDAIEFSDIKSNDDIIKIKSKLKKLGESIEKDMVLARLNRIKTKN